MISVLLATYNWPQALKLCLESLSTQTDLDFEIEMNIKNEFENLEFTFNLDSIRVKSVLDYLQTTTMDLTATYRGRLTS